MKQWHEIVHQRRFFDQEFQDRTVERRQTDQTPHPKSQSEPGVIGHPPKPLVFLPKNFIGSVGAQFTQSLALLDSTLHRTQLFSTHWLTGSQLTVLRFVLAPYKAFAFAFFFAFSLLLTVAALFW